MEGCGGWNCSRNLTNARGKLRRLLCSAPRRVCEWTFCSELYGKFSLRGPSEELEASSCAWDKLEKPLDIVGELIVFSNVAEGRPRVALVFLQTVAPSC